MNILCPICNESVSLENTGTTTYAAMTKCGHVYHIQCLQRWMCRSKTCPQCREPISDASLFRIYATISDDVQEALVAQLHSTLDHQGSVLDAQKTLCREKDAMITSLQRNLKEKELFSETLRESMNRAAKGFAREKLALTTKNRQELKDLQEKNASLMETVSRLNSDVAAAQMKISSLRVELFSMKKNNERMFKLQSEKEKEMQTLNRDLSSAKEQLEMREVTIKHLKEKMANAGKTSESRLENDNIPSQGNNAINEKVMGRPSAASQCVISVSDETSGKDERIKEMTIKLPNVADSILSVDIKEGQGSIKSIAKKDTNESILSLPVPVAGEIKIRVRFA